MIAFNSFVFIHVKQIFVNIDIYFIYLHEAFCSKLVEKYLTKWLDVFEIVLYKMLNQIFLFWDIQTNITLKDYYYKNIWFKYIGCVE